jgi:hypothetical protein
MKLPINPLLYLLSAGLFAGSGLLFYQALTAPRPRPYPELDAEAKDKENEGRAKEPDEQKTDVYGGTMVAFWRRFKEVNLIGKLPPPPEKPVDDGPKEIPKPPVVPLDDIFTVVCILSIGDDTTVIVRYKPTANVVPPDPLPLAPASVPAARPAGAGPADVVRPGPGPVVPGRPALPVPAAVDPKGPIHHVRLEQTLWKPFDNIRLVGITDDALGAYFLREEPDKPRDAGKKELVLRNEFELDPEVLASIRQAGLVDPARAGTTAGGAASQPAAVAASGWIPAKETREVSPGVIHIGSDDDEYLRNETQRVLEDLPIRDYQSPQGTMRGIQLRKAITDPRLARFGAQEGDVLLSINGQPTKTRSQAIHVVKEEYNRGVRRFEAEIFRAGQRVTLTYVARDK